MGWTTMHKDKGTTPRMVIEGLFVQHAIVAYGTHGKEVYVAARDTRQGPDAPVTAFVILTATYRDYFNFGYKDMSEEMGPYYCNAPAKVLDALSPTTDESALAWRAKCRANLAKPLPQDGDFVRFAQPLNFGSHGYLQEFTFHREGRKTYFTLPNAGRYGTHYRIPNLQNYSFEVWGRTGAVSPAVE